MGVATESVLVVSFFSTSLALFLETDGAAAGFSFSVVSSFTDSGFATGAFVLGVVVVTFGLGVCVFAAEFVEFALGVDMLARLVGLRCCCNGFWFFRAVCLIRGVVTVASFIVVFDGVVTVCLVATNFCGVAAFVGVACNGAVAGEGAFFSFTADSGVTATGGVACGFCGTDWALGGVVWGAAGTAGAAIGATVSPLFTVI